MNQPKFEINEVVRKKGTKQLLIVTKIHESKRTKSFYYDVMNYDGTAHPYWYYERQLERFGRI